MNTQQLRALLQPIAIGTLLGAVFRIADSRNSVGSFMARHPVTATMLSFAAGTFATGIYLSYLKTTENSKLPSMPAGLIKKWDTPARNLQEILGRRTRGRVVWQWPSKPIKKGTAKAKYSMIWKYFCENPENTYEQLAEVFDVDRKTVERALRAGRTGQLANAT